MVNNGLAAERAPRDLADPLPRQLPRYPADPQLPRDLRDPLPRRLLPTPPQTKKLYSLPDIRLPSSPADEEILNTVLILYSGAGPRVMLLKMTQLWID